MENFIPFLIGIALFIFKIWSNFRKEQEKARKRNPGKQIPAVEKAKEAARSRYPESKPEPFLLEESHDANNPYEPKYKHLYQREVNSEKKLVTKREELVPRESVTVREGYNPESAAEEIEVNRKIHKPHKHLQPPPHEEQTPVYFDMKDAVIKEAILNRPKF